MYSRMICEKTHAAHYALLALSRQEKDDALQAIAHALRTSVDKIVKANQTDMAYAKNMGMAEVMLDRLLITHDRVMQMASAVEALIQLEDPIGRSMSEWSVKEGLTIDKKVVPFGVVGMIYESRPNVTVDATCIALKTSNAIVLKGGKEAITTNRQLVEIMRAALSQLGIDPDVIGFVDSVDREVTEELLGMKGLIDVLIPRGSHHLINWVVANAKVPVIETGAGNCHFYIDEEADLDKALVLINNAKMQRPSVCNALEKLILHEKIAEKCLAKLQSLLGDRLRLEAHESAKHLLPHAPVMDQATLFTEYLDYTLGVILVKHVDEAIRWINHYGSHHSDGIITENKATAERFLLMVDSAAVYHNASTRFTDGGEFGFGAEIGIATSKLHARGPMGLEAMTTYKYLVSGQGHIRT